VQLIPVPVAHTDGDTMVYFPNANVIMTGDFHLVKQSAKNACLALVIVSRTTQAAFHVAESFV